MLRESGVNVKLFSKLEDRVFLVIIIQITTYDTSYKFCIKFSYINCLLK